MGGGSGSGNSVIKEQLLPPWALDVEVPRYLEDMKRLSLEEYIGYAEVTYALQGEGFTWIDSNGSHTIDPHTHEFDGIKALAYAGREAAGDRRTLLTKAETLLQNVIDGIKLNANTKLDAAYLKRAEVIVKEFEETILPRLAQQMNLSGNFGSYGHHYLMAKEAETVMAKLADIGLDLYFKDYILEKTFQQDSVTLAPAFSEQELINAELQIKAGELQREYYQGKLIDDWRKFTEYQQGLIRRLDVAGNSIRAFLGAQSNEVVPYYRPSDMSQVAGLALAGMGLYGSIKGAQNRQETLVGSSSTGTEYLKTSSSFTAKQQDFIGGQSGRRP